MKPKILKLCSIVLLLFFMGAGCQKDELEYADEGIVVSNHPWVSVYKTRGDYLHLVSVQITPEGQLNALPTIQNDKSNIEVDRNGDIKLKCRHLLKNGYIVGCGGISDAFTDITYNEYVKYNDEHNLNHWASELIKPRIIDYNPYLEFYWMGCRNCELKEFTLGEIYEMLENGTIEEHFTRLK